MYSSYKSAEGIERAQSENFFWLLFKWKRIGGVAVQGVGETAVFCGREETVMWCWAAGLWSQGLGVASLFTNFAVSRNGQISMLAMSQYGRNAAGVFYPIERYFCVGARLLYNS